MTDVPDPMKSLGFSQEFLAAHHAAFLAEADRSVIHAIRCGVLFLMAFWSGPARVAFAALKQVLVEADPRGRLDLVVVDTDGCPDLHHLPEFDGQLAGVGETAWVKDGRIISTALRPTAEAFRANTLALLKECAT